MRLWFNLIILQVIVDNSKIKSQALLNCLNTRLEYSFDLQDNFVLCGWIGICQLPGHPVFSFNCWHFIELILYLALLPAKLETLEEIQMWYSAVRDKWSRKKRGSWNGMPPYNHCMWPSEIRFQPINIVWWTYIVIIWHLLCNGRRPTIYIHEVLNPYQRGRGRC